MVINHLDKLFVTSDTATIVTELEVEHPAAKLLVMAAKAQEAEIGDATNLVLSLYLPVPCPSAFSPSPQQTEGHVGLQNRTEHSGQNPCTWPEEMEQA